MGRSTPCCDKVGLKKGPWTPEEDHMLISYIQLHGHGSCWRAFPAKAGLRRCGKSCRLRWLNYLRPDIKRGKFSIQEEQTTIQLHALLGNRWSTIAAHLPKRTDNEIKNYWNTHLKKRLTNMGIDPVTHKPKTNALGSAHSKAAANLSHVVQWENARLEAEARLVRESKPVASKPYHSQLGSSSAQLLNKAAATQLPPCLDVLKAWQSGWSKSTIHNPSAGANSFESPTSILNFSKNTFLAPTIASFDVNLVENIMKIDESLSQNEWESLEILQNNFPEAKQGIITVNPMESHENTLLSSFLEGVTDHLLYDTYDSPNFSMVMF